jgi:hypothetical protein
MQLTKKAFESNGKEIVVSIVMLGESEGMFLPDVATALNVDSSTIRTHIRNHNLCVEIFNGQSLDDAKQQGLVSKMVRSINLVPRDTIKALVKIVNTPEAWSAYNYLWEVAVSPTTAAAHYTAIGKGADLVAEINKLKDADSQRPLTQEQKSAVSRLVEQRLRDIGINPMVNWVWTSPLGHIPCPPTPTEALTYLNHCTCPSYYWNNQRDPRAISAILARSVFPSLLSGQSPFIRPVPTTMDK